MNVWIFFIAKKQIPTNDNEKYIYCDEQKKWDLGKEINLVNIF